VNDERQVRDGENTGGDRQIPCRGAPAALGEHSDDPKRREEPRDLLCGEREAEGHCGPFPIAVHPRDHERERVKQVRASADR